MMENFEIIPGKGVGNILLGMTSAKIEEILGAPDDKEIFEYDDGETSCTYYYFDLDLDLTFESDDDDKLSFISVENEKFSLLNRIKIGQNKEEVIGHAKSLNFCEPELEDLSSEDSPNQELLSYDLQNINFWFTDNRLDEIQFGPFWEDDETPIWPEK
jgi:hypothetical protein